MTDTNLDQFSIGELAKELNITTRTIRYYEERGLIEPERGNGRQRIYTRRERG
ncbi:MAG: MerR family DNA-binding transcriptional regulator, partial [Anaerolineales bacterium]|nr:MerR family DNA-binding transcriptional regulator [Anaerolineales bacterium]